MEIYAFIVLKDNKIIAIYESANIEGVQASLSYEGITQYDEIIKTFQGFLGVKGQDIREFDKDFNLKPDIVRMKEGYLDIPKGKKLNSDATELIDKTLKEKINDKEIVLNENEIYDDSIQEIRAKKYSELFSSNLLSLEDYIQDTIRPIRNDKLNECDLVYCNAERWSTYTDEQKSKWRKYKQTLRDLPSNITTIIDDVESIFPKLP